MRSVWSLFALLLLAQFVPAAEVPIIINVPTPAESAGKAVSEVITVVSPDGTVTTEAISTDPQVRGDKLRTIVAAASDNQTITIPTGEYRISGSPITITKAITLQATDAVLKRADGFQSSAVLSCSGSGRLRLKGVKVDGNRSSFITALTENNHNIEIKGYDTVELIDVESVNTPHLDSPSAPRCLQVSRDVGRLVVRGGLYRNGGWSCLRIQAAKQEYYGVEVEITEPNVLPTDRDAVTVSTTSNNITATDGIAFSLAV